MAWFGLAYLALLGLVLVLNFHLARRNARIYPLVGQGSLPPTAVHADGQIASPARPLPTPEYVARLTSEQATALFRDYRRTAALRPGGLISGGRA